MRAVWYSSLGQARDVLEVGDMATPQVADGEVRVRVATSGINPVDTKRRTGGRGAMGPHLVVPHFDGAGTIDQVGAGVEPGRVGERVWIYEAQWGSDFGTAAEYVTVPSDRAIVLPESASLSDGACLGIPALTAHRCVFADGSVQGKTILVTGGAGAVGNYAIQFAALSGARVLSTVSGAAKAELAAAAGAEAIINYREEDVAARVNELTHGEGVDRIVEVEMGGNLATSLEILKPTGVISSYASEGSPEPVIPFYAMLYKNVTLRFELVFLMPEEAKRAAVLDITQWLESDRLKHTVAEVFALENVVAAHEAVEAGPLGKILLDLDA